MPSNISTLQYLVGTPTFIDLARRGAKAPNWSSNIKLRVCALSVISLAQALSRAEEMDSLNPSKSTWFHHIKAVEGRFQIHDGLIGIDRDIANVWSQIRHLPLKFLDEHGNEQILPPDYGLILATALERNLTLLEPHQTYHDQLYVRGLRVQDPSTIRTQNA